MSVVELSDDKREQLDMIIAAAVVREQDRQIAKWGVQCYDPLEWNAILVEEVGEVSKAILESHYRGRIENWDEYRKELIHVAAVAMSAIRSLDLTTL